MATELSNELMDKQAATMDSLAAGEDADSTHKKKQKVEEEEEDDDNGGFGYDFDPSIDLTNVSTDELRPYNWPGKEPEWDVDSYDEYEFNESKIHPLVRKIFKTQESFDEYYNRRLESFKSKGFLADPRCDIYDVYLEDGPVGHYKTTRDMVADLANMCVKKYNETKNKTVEFVNVVRATEGGGGPSCKFYITFMAREYPTGPLVEYQAKVISYLRDDIPPFPILCRPAPKPEI